MTAYLLPEIRRAFVTRFRSDPSEPDRRGEKQSSTNEQKSTTGVAQRARPSIVAAKEPDWHGQWRLLRYL